MFGGVFDRAFIEHNAMQGAMREAVQGGRRRLAFAVVSRMRADGSGHQGEVLDAAQSYADDLQLSMHATKNPPRSV